MIIHRLKVKIGRHFFVICVQVVVINGRFVQIDMGRVFIAVTFELMSTLDLDDKRGRSL